MRRRRHSFNIFFPKACAHLSHQIKQRTHENFYTLYRIDIFDIVPIQTVGELKSCREIF